MTVWLGVAGISALAAILRLEHLGASGGDPFYDGAVRSMALSWHNFFFGALEPGGSIAIDKPPVDLWLQVGASELLGFHNSSLHLPQALAGVAAVPIVFAAVRVPFGVRSGLGAAAAMAVLPIEVITARSDTMDAVMMTFTAAALLLVVIACKRDSPASLIGAAVLMGVAFNVKLFEAVIALPGLTLLAYLGMNGRRGRRLALIALAAVVYVAVALSWLSATLLVPAGERPYAIGSTNGSAWNAAFIFNGIDRLTGKATIGASEITTTDRSANASIPNPSVTRLLASSGPLSGQRLGLELLAALLFGAPALLFGWRRVQAGRPTAIGQFTEPPPPQARIARATLAGIALWLATGAVLFSQMRHLHPRYTEAFLPAVVALLGIGVAWVTGSRRLAHLLVLCVGLIGLVCYEAYLLGTPTTVWWISCGAAAVALTLTAMRRTPALIWLCTLVCVLAVPLANSLRAVDHNVSDTNRLGVLRAGELDPLSVYLRAHQGTARYEVAYESATKIGALVLKDTRPVLALSAGNGHSLVSVASLKRLIAAGRVRYAFLGMPCTDQTPPASAACEATATWIRAHAQDVSGQAHLPHNRLLWKLPTASR